MSPINLYFSFSSLREARILLPMFICLHIFALDYVKNFAALSANHRISAKSVEVKPVPERLRNWSCYYHTSGQPLPVHLAIVTISGITSCISNSQ